MRKMQEGGTMTLLEKIKNGFVFFDGGYGTILQSKAIKMKL